jgi:ketosteroid isomerase-like protein
VKPPLDADHEPASERGPRGSGLSGPDRGGEPPREAAPDSRLPGEGEMSPEGYSAVMEEESATPDLVELNRRAIESATRGDFDAAMSSYGPDSVWDTSPLGMGTYRGVATIRTALEEWYGLYEELEVEIRENVDLGDGVILAVVRQRGRPVGSSGYAQLHFASVTEWTDRVIARVTPYTDIDEARAAAERLVESRGGRWQANVELVGKSFEAHRTGGIAAALRFYAPDFVWYPGPGWVEDDVYRGHDGARRLNAIFLENFEDYVLAVHEIRAVGDRVLALYEATGRIKGSGLPIRQPIGIVLSRFHDEMISEVRSFFSWREALETVGLSG